MELKTAIEILDYHQEWRLGKREDMIHEPKKLTEALDVVLSEVKNLLIHNVSDWLSINENIDLLQETNVENILLKFDDGSICKYGDEHPIAIVTHFKII